MKIGLAVLMVLVFYGVLNNYRESFSDDNYCQKKSLSQCTKNTDCGLCVQGDMMGCVKGDPDGPSFRENCEFWVTNDAQNKNQVISRPYDYTSEYAGRKYLRPM